MAEPIPSIEQAPVPADISPVSTLEGDQPARAADGIIPPAPLAETPSEAAHASVIAACTLQPDARYGDAPLASIPGWTVVDLLPETEKDDYGRPWRRVAYGDQVGYVQSQNLRLG